MRKNYPTDLSDSQWKIIQHFFEDRTDRRGRPSQHSTREIINAIFYILRAGCSWCLLPHDFPPWQTVYNHFYDWQNLGLWERINEKLVQQWRLQKGRKKDPTAAIIDSQSVKTTEKGGSKDMMELRKSEEESDTFLWIQKVTFSLLMLVQQMKRTAKGL